MAPSEGEMVPINSRANVVLPEPLSPAIVVILGSSSLIVSETSSTATMGGLVENAPPPNSRVT